MPNVAIGRIAKAIESLQRFHAFFGVTFLSMKESGVATGAPIVWGTPQEDELLKKYYSPPGAPPGKPFCIPFKAPRATESEKGLWRNPKYSGGTLQRARKSDRFKDALKHPTPREWAFTDDYIEVLEALLPKGDNNSPVRIPILDLVAWMFRDRDLPASFDDIIRTFRSEFRLTNDEVAHLFDVGTSRERADQFFFDQPTDRSELIELLEGIPEGPVLGDRTEDDMVAAIEQYIEGEALLSLPVGFVRDFYCALKTQRFVVLAGRPGTGKTAFARAFAAALKNLFPGAVTEVIVSVGQDFGETDALGYEKIAGGLAPTELTRALFLDGRSHDIFVVVIDEMNLAHVDYYLARLLPGIESDAPVQLPGADTRYDLPPDSLFIGTVNSFIEEPTRVALSGPVKRRSNIIEMPNTLELVIRANDRDAFRELVVKLLGQAKERCVRRQQQGLGSVLDAFRIQDLEHALGSSSRVLVPEIVDALWQLGVVCSVDSQTSLTLGVLQDVAEYIALAKWASALEALDRQIAQKLVPQLSGPAAVIKKVLEFVDSLRTGTGRFDRAEDALRRLLESEDPSSGLVYYRY